MLMQQKFQIMNHSIIKKSMSDHSINEIVFNRDFIAPLNCRTSYSKNIKLVSTMYEE